MVKYFSFNLATSRSYQDLDKAMWFESFIQKVNTRTITFCPVFKICVKFFSVPLICTLNTMSVHSLRELWGRGNPHWLVLRPFSYQVSLPLANISCASDECLLDLFLSYRCNDCGGRKFIHLITFLYAHSFLHPLSLFLSFVFMCCLYCVIFTYYHHLQLFS